MKDVVTDFKKFINKGNVIDLAAGIIIGTAFTAIVNSLVNDIVMPLISRMINFDLTSAKTVLREEVLDEEGEIVIKAITLNYGSFIQNVINFFIIALAIYVAVKTIRFIKNGYIRSEIKYIKKLKAKHPELFDEEDEPGTLLYEKLKKNHPEYFKTEIAQEIEAKKAKEKRELSPQEINNELLLRLNENLERVYGVSNAEEDEIRDIVNEEKEKEIKEYKIYPVNRTQ